MIERVLQPADPRLAPIERLGELAQSPSDDPEAQAERKLLRRLDLQDAVRKP